MTGEKLKQILSITTSTPTMKEAIINLLAWEKYIPVMTEKEQRDIMQGGTPTATQQRQFTLRETCERWMQQTAE